MLKRNLRIFSICLSVLILINSFAPAAFAEQRGGSQDVSVDALNFPDEAFRSWILDKNNLGGAGADGVLSEDEILSITEMNLSSASSGRITSLEGISNFTALKSLSVSNHQLTALDVSSNTELEYLNCSSNRLSSIDLGANLNLRMLNCSSNYLTSLNLGNNTKLTTIYASSNLLPAINLSNNTALVNVDLFDNALESIELSTLLQLQKLIIDTNKIEELDLSANSNIEFFSAQYNRLTKIIFPNAPDLTVSFDCFSEQNPETGYDLVEWFEDDMYSVEINGDVTAQGQTIYGKRIANTYKIVYNSNGGNGSMEQQNGIYGEELELNANKFTRYGYYFSGWNTVPGGSGYSYSDAQRVQNIGGKTNGETVYLYAQWSPNKYTVKYDANHDEAQGSMNDSEGYFDKYLSLSPNSFTNSRFDFMGWSKSPDGPVLYADGASVQNLSAVNGSTVTLYAVWSLKASELQKPFMEKLQEEFRQYQNGDYTDEDWQALADIYSLGADGIAGADKNTSKMQAALDDAVSKMKAVHTYELRLAEIENGWSTEYGDVLAAVNQKPMDIFSAGTLAVRIAAALENGKEDGLKTFSTLKDPATIEALALIVSEKIEKTISDIECLNRSVLWYNSLDALDLKPLNEIRSTHFEALDAKMQEYNALGESEKEYIPDSVLTSLEERRELSDEKRKAVEKLNAEYSKYDLSEYSEDGQSGLKTAFENGVEAVEQSASSADIESAVDESVIRMNSVLTLEQEETNKPAPEEQPDSNQKPNGGSGQNGSAGENNSNNNTNIDSNTSTNNTNTSETAKPSLPDKSETTSAQSENVSGNQVQSPAEQAQESTDVKDDELADTDVSDSQQAQSSEEQETDKSDSNKTNMIVWIVTAGAALIAAVCVIWLIRCKRSAS